MEITFGLVGVSEELHRGGIFLDVSPMGGILVGVLGWVQLGVDGSSQGEIATGGW